MVVEQTRRTCIACGRVFTSDKFHPYQRFCSKRCKWRWHSNNGRKKEYYHKLRIKALNALGARCAICALDDPFMLTIDHINGDWRDDPFNRRNKRALYRHILQDPERAKKRFQILCWNHNGMKALYPKEFLERYSTTR